MCHRPLKQRAHERGVSLWARCASGLRDRAGKGSVLVAVLVAAYGIATLSQQNDVPNKFWLSGHSGALLLVILGVVAGVGSFFVTFNVKGLLDRAESDGKLNSPCRDMAWLMETDTGIPRGAVGVHVWEIAGPFFARRLRRRATFRTTRGRQTAVLWTCGKGVVGQCWADGEATDQLSDLQALHAAAVNEARFCTLPAKDRFNMTHREFKAGEHYDLIWVTKLYKGSGDAPKLRGMLSVDVEGTGHADALADALTRTSKEVRALLDMCESLL